MPEVSLIIPTYNAAEFLPDCIRSIEKQSFGDLQIIFVDDGSKDESARIIDQFKKTDARVEKYQFEKNMGSAAARNFGLTKASGRYVRFVDADDILTVNSVNCLYEAARSSKADFVRGNCLVFKNSEPDKFFPMRNIEWTENATGLNYLNQNYQGLPWCHPVFLFKHDFLKRKNIRYPNLRMGEDPVFLLRALVESKRAGSVAEVVYKYRAYKKTSSRFTRNEEFEDYLKHYLALEVIWTSAMRSSEWVDYFNKTFWWFWRRLVENNSRGLLLNFDLVQNMLTSISKHEMLPPADIDIEYLQAARKLSLQKFEVLTTTRQLQSDSLTGITAQ
jgi:glycosyltransferase involved in cell wall biosynthesis